MNNLLWTPDQKLLALSWKQPFAELMLHGKIETRTWNTNYRGWVLICASQKSYSDNEVRNISGEHQHTRIKIVYPISSLGELELRIGVAIAIGYLNDCRPMKPEDEDKCFVKFYPDLFCHIYEHVHAIEPLPWKGSQGWKEVTDYIRLKIKYKHL